MRLIVPFFVVAIAISPVFAEQTDKSTSSASGGIVDAYAAKVNSDVITVGDVMAEIRRNPALRSEAASLNDEAFMHRLYKETLDMMIDRRLILKAASDAKMELQDWVVENRIREIEKDGFGGDENKLLAALAEAKINYSDWRTTIRDDLIIAAMRYQTIEKNIIASPGAMRAEYAVNSAQYATGGTVTVSVILLRPTLAGDTNAPSVEVRGEAILDRIGKGENFEDLARAYSADSHAADGGIWKDVKPEDVFRPEISEAIKKLSVGEHSGVVKIGEWGFIVRKNSEVPARVRSFREAYLDIERNVKATMGRKLYEDWIKTLKSEAYVQVYALPENRF